jgi:hypothetical protein
MLEIHLLQPLVDQWTHIYSISLIETTDFLSQPASSGELGQVAVFMYNIHLECFYHYLWKLVIDDVILIGLVAAIEHGLDAVEQLLRDTHYCHIEGKC